MMSLLTLGVFVLRDLHRGLPEDRPEELAVPRLSLPCCPSPPPSSSSSTSVSVLPSVDLWRDLLLVFGDEDEDEASFLSDMLRSDLIFLELFLKNCGELSTDLGLALSFSRIARSVEEDVLEGESRHDEGSAAAEGLRLSLSPLKSQCETDL